MKYGMNLLLWTGELNDEVVPVLEMLKGLGYDGVEIPIFNADLDYAAWGQRFDDRDTFRFGAISHLRGDLRAFRPFGLRRQDAVDGDA